jgi:hypothetical protein
MESRINSTQKREEYVTAKVGMIHIMLGATNCQLETPKRPEEQNFALSIVSSSHNTTQIPAPFSTSFRVGGEV